MPFVLARPFSVGPEKTVTAAPEIGVRPSACVTRPAIDPGWNIETLIVVVALLVIAADRTSLEYPVPYTRRSYVPGSRLPSEYEPLLGVVPVALIRPWNTAWTVAPTSGLPLAACVMVPATVPGTITVNTTPLLS